jgi:hypothetical protein
LQRILVIVVAESRGGGRASGASAAQTAYRRMNDKLVVADFEIEIKLI